MSASEQMYFEGAPNAHVVQYQDRQLDQRRAAEMRAFARRIGSRRS